MRTVQKIESLRHPMVLHWVKLRTDVNYRLQQQMLLLEGSKPISELTIPIDKIIYTAAYETQANALKANQKYQISNAIVQKISGAKEPEGLLVEVKMPSFSTLSSHHNRILALDGINDPGNLGTLLRTALAFGWSTIYFLPGCCDLFNDKTLRAARGAHFKLNLIKGSFAQLHLWTTEQNVQALVADLAGMKLEAVPLAQRRLLVLGNEAHGPQKAIREFCTPVTIAIDANAMESLNVAVAGGIMLHFLAH